MLFGLDYVMAGYIHLASGQITCQLKKSPEINVSATDTTLKIDHSKTQAELDQFSIDTVSPYGEKVQTHVGGLMSGEVKTSSNMSLMSETYPALNAACIMIDKINVKIHIEPTIYIAKEYKKTGCMYKAVMEHEKKHVKVDRMIANKYTSLIIKAIDGHYKKMGYKVGPFSIQTMPDVQQSINIATNRIVKQYSDAMSAERKKLQQQVDSLDEYNRVNGACKGRE